MGTILIIDNNIINKATSINSYEEKKTIYYGKITEGKLNGYGRLIDLFGIICRKWSEIC